MTIGKRIKQARQAQSLTQEALSDKCGWGRVRQRISIYERGQSNPGSNELIKLSNALGVSTDWLLGQDTTDLAKRIQNKLEESITDDNQLKSKLVENTTLIPIIAWSEIRNGIPETSTSDHTEFVVTNINSPNAFAIIIEGNSMETSSGVSFFEGARVVIDPKKDPQLGDFVLAYIEGSNAAIFRQFSSSSGKLNLKALNDTHPLIPITEKIKFLGTATTIIFPL